MADVSKVTVESTTYDLKDATSRALASTALQPSALEPYRTAEAQDAIDATHATKAEFNAFAENQEDVNAQVGEIALSMRRELPNIYDALKGKAFAERVDTAEAYTKPVPAGALSYGSVDMVGGKTVVWNQYASRLSDGITPRIFQANNFDVSQEAQGVMRLTAKNTTSSSRLYSLFKFLYRPYFPEIPPVAVGHVYFFAYDVRGNIPNIRIGSRFISSAYSDGPLVDLAETWKKYERIVTANDASLSNTEFSVNTPDIPDVSAISGKWLEFKNSTFIDLTAMFGAGNEPATTDDPRTTWVKKYAAAHPEYNPGELLSAQVDEVESVGADDAIIGSLEIPASVRNLCPNYGASAGSVYNYIDWERKVYVQRVGSRAHQSGDESDATVVTDGTTTYYPLAAPVEVDLSSVLGDNIIEVEGGGTLAFENEALLSVPNKTTSIVKISDALGA